MDRKEVIALLKRYRDQNENLKINDRIISFINSNLNYQSKYNKQGHLTVSAWILSRDLSKVVLMHNRHRKAWYQIGGHIEEFDKNIYSAIEREIKEETGLKNFCINKKEIFFLGIHMIPEDLNGFRSHYHYNIVFLGLADTTDELSYDEKESDEVRWVNLDIVPSFTKDEMILEMCAKINRVRKEDIEILFK